MESKIEQVMREYNISIEIEKLRKEYDAIFFKVRKECYEYGRYFIIRELRGICNFKIWDEKEIKEKIFELLLRKSLYNINIKIIEIYYDTYIVFVKLHKKRF